MPQSWCWWLAITPSSHLCKLQIIELVSPPGFLCSSNYIVLARHHGFRTLIIVKRVLICFYCLWFLLFQPPCLDCSIGLFSLPPSKGLRTRYFSVFLLWSKASGCSCLLLCSTFLLSPFIVLAQRPSSSLLSNPNQEAGAAGMIRAVRHALPAHKIGLFPPFPSNQFELIHTNAGKA